MAWKRQHNTNKSLLDMIFIISKPECCHKNYRVSSRERSGTQWTVTQCKLEEYEKSRKSIGLALSQYCCRHMMISTNPEKWLLKNRVTVEQLYSTYSTRTQQKFIYCVQNYILKFWFFLRQGTLDLLGKSPDWPHTLGNSSASVSLVFATRPSFIFS